MTTPIRGAAEYRTLADALEHTDPLCRNDWRFTVDADDLDDESAQMRTICAECPLIQTCREYAITARPKGGFWAGRYWGRKERSVTALSQRDSAAFQMDSVRNEKRNQVRCQFRY